MNIYPYEKTIIKEDDLQIEQPSTIKCNLFMHQKTLVYKLGQIEKNNEIKIDDSNSIKTNILIISDLIGSGKTLSVISLIATFPYPTSYHIFNSYTNSMFYSSCSYIECNKLYSNLIVVSHSLIKQWEDTIKLSNLKYYVIKTKKTLEGLDLNLIEDYDIILVSSTKSMEFMNEWCKITECNWNRIIIDEIHTIKVPFSRELLQRCNFLYFISATPDEILIGNRCQAIKYVLGNEIYNYNSHSHYSIKYKLCIKNEDSFVEKSISLPEIKKKYIECLTPLILKHFSTSLPEKALKLLNAGCEKDAIKAIKVLNCNVDTSTNIISCLTIHNEKELHNINTQITYVNNLIISDHDKNTRLKKLNEQKNKYETTIDGIKQRILSINSEVCPICLESFKTPSISNCCKNIFCMECILQCTKYKKIQCPFCRIEINAESLHVIDNDKKLIKSSDSDSESDIKPKKLNKDQMLIQILKNATEDQKFLICSNYDNTFDTITKYLNDNDIKFSTLGGHITTINNIIDDFKSGKKPIILLNSNNFGSGLNLEMTTDIIIYHKLSENLEKQVIGRGQRLGRTSQLNVTYLTYDEEYSNSYYDPNNNLYY